MIKQLKSPKLEKFSKDAVEKVTQLAERVLESANDVPNKELFKALLEQELPELARVVESATTTADIDVIAKIVIPAIKKVARDNIAIRLVGVQPIEMKGATVLYEDIVYTQSTDEVNAGESIYDKPSTHYAQGVGEGQPITRSLKYTLREIPVEIREKSLISSWSWEVDEVSSTLKIDIEKEIGKALAQKIDEEISFEIIDELRTYAKGFQSTYNVPTSSDTSAQKQEKINDLIDKIYEGRDEIYDKTGRYPNWIVVSPKLASMLKRNGVLTVFTPTSDETMSMQRLYQCGTLEDELQVFIVRGYRSNDVILGYKGQSETQTGYIYAPITTVKIPPTFFDVRTYEFIKSLKRYYGVAKPRMELYGVIKGVNG
jgi:hypothetical protein